MADRKDYYAKSAEFGKKAYALVKEYWNDLNADAMVGHLFMLAHLVTKRRFDFSEKRRAAEGGKNESGN